MNIQPIVEGRGEVLALPFLLRRLIEIAGAYQIGVNPPIRRHASDFSEESSVKKAVRLALKQDECGAILILFDGDMVPEPICKQGPKVAGWAGEEAGTVPCAVVIACREYEAWFLAAIESLRGLRGVRDDAVSHPAPETLRRAKAQLEARMKPGYSYSEAADQPALTRHFDMATAHARCRSFRKMVKSFGELAAGLGADIGAWPPDDWPRGS